MRQSQEALLRFLLAGLVVTAAVPAATARQDELEAELEARRVGDGKPKFEIMDVRFGFQGKYKTGEWAPLIVDLKATNDKFEGSLQIVAPDYDKLATTLVVPDVFVTKNQDRRVYHYARIGTVGEPLVVRLIDRDGRVVDTDSRELSRAGETLDHSQALTLAAGRPAGVAQAVDDDRTDKTRHAYTSVVEVEEMPTQWFAYGPVRELVLTTDQSALFERTGIQRQEAIRTWVRQGGHLIVTVSNNWQVVSKSFLADLLPATLTGEKPLRQTDAIEYFGGGDENAAPLPVGDQGLAVADLKDVRGSVLLEQGDVPLIVKDSYGLGTVTLVAFDADRPPFTQWDGRQDFWRKLLRLRSQNLEQNGGQSNAWNSGYVTDSSSLAHSYLESFPEVTVVPFGWVAILIFGYILLIGPIDYFFLKKVVGRLELTWITFPTWVILISVAAYFSAYWLKGDDLRINRIEVVDVDETSGTLRGTSMMSVFSPQIARYDITLTPGLAATGGWQSVSGARTQADRNATFFGTPESGFQGMNGGGSGGLFGRRGYRYTSPRAEGLAEVPIQVWSMKTFLSQWLAAGQSPLTTELTATGGVLVGSIENTLDEPLRDVQVFYQERVWSVPKLDPGVPVDLAGVKDRPVASFLSGLSMDPNRDNSRAGILNDGVRDVVMGMMFDRRAAGSGGNRLGSHYLAELDLSDLLDLDRVIVVGRLERPGGRLWLNQKPEDDAEPAAPDGEMRTNTFLRIVVRPAAGDGGDEDGSFTPPKS